MESRRNVSGGDEWETRDRPQVNRHKKWRHSFMNSRDGRIALARWFLCKIAPPRRKWESVPSRTSFANPRTRLHKPVYKTSCRVAFPIWPPTTPLPPLPPSRQHPRPRSFRAFPSHTLARHTMSDAEQQQSQDVEPKAEDANAPINIKVGTNPFATQNWADRAHALSFLSLRALLAVRCRSRRRPATRCSSRLRGIRS